MKLSNFSLPSFYSSLPRALLLQNLLSCLQRIISQKSMSRFRGGEVLIVNFSRHVFSPHKAMSERYSLILFIYVKRTYACITFIYKSIIIFISYSSHVFSLTRLDHVLIQFFVVYAPFLLLFKQFHAYPCKKKTTYTQHKMIHSG